MCSSDLVGLPIAVEFGKRHATLGFDTDPAKIAACAGGSDPTGQISAAEFRKAARLEFSGEPDGLAGRAFVIIAVPTPVDSARRPDFSPLLDACRIVGRHMSAGTTVVFESTVYPGATEEVCIPVLEIESGMRWREHFQVAYSPERINPGDREHSLTRIVKLVAGDSEETLEAVARLYESAIEAGVHRVSSIRVAEAAKVIENTQRDVNIALVNELAVIFNRLGLDTQEVLDAAGTKWNFLPFRPGLVGGHCIGVDPYYLTHKAQQVGYHPQVILGGRMINDGMAKFIAEQTVKQLTDTGARVHGAKVNVLGLSFKENCDDTRNSQVVPLIAELRSYGLETFVHDPVANASLARADYALELLPWDELPVADVIVAAVSHQRFLERPVGELVAKVRRGGCFIDVKSAFDRAALEQAGLVVWRL